jgi:hypothetical protein
MSARLDSVEVWPSLCVEGVYREQAEVVLDASDQTIALDEENGLYYNSRGVVRLQVVGIKLEPQKIVRCLGNGRRQTKMSKELMKQFRNRWQAVAVVEAREQQAASIMLRWRQMNAIFRLAFGLKLPTTNLDREEEVVRERWTRLKGV